MGPRNNILDGVQMPTCEGTILRVKRGMCRTCRDMSGSRYTQSDSAGGNTVMMQMPTGVF